MSNLSDFLNRSIQSKRVQPKQKYVIQRYANTSNCLKHKIFMYSCAELFQDDLLRDLYLTYNVDGYNDITNITIWEDYTPCLVSFELSEISLQSPIGYEYLLVRLQDYAQNLSGYVRLRERVRLNIMSGCGVAPDILELLKMRGDTDMIHTIQRNWLIEQPLCTGTQTFQVFQQQAKVLAAQRQLWQYTDNLVANAVQDLLKGRYVANQVIDNPETGGATKTTLFNYMLNKYDVYHHWLTRDWVRDILVGVSYEDGEPQLSTNTYCYFPNSRAPGCFRKLYTKLIQGNGSTCSKVNKMAVV